MDAPANPMDESQKVESEKRRLDSVKYIQTSESSTKDGSQVVNNANVDKVQSKTDEPDESVIENPTVTNSCEVLSGPQVQLEVVFNANVDKVQSKTDGPDKSVIENPTIMNSFEVLSETQVQQEVINNANVDRENSKTDGPDESVIENTTVMNSSEVLSEAQVQLEFVQVVNDAACQVESELIVDSPGSTVASEYTHLLDPVVVSEAFLETDEDSDSVSNQLKKLNLRMTEYEKQIKLQNKEIIQMKEKIKEKDREIEKYQTRSQDVSFVKSRLKEKDKEVQNMKQEFNRNRSLVGDLQMSVKQIHNQLKSMANNALEFEDRLTDLEKLSPKMGVFEWRLEHYGYHSQNSEFLCSPEFYTHLNGYCCYLSVQWFGNKNGRLGLYLHLDKKKNLHLVETCKINMLIQCVGCFGLTKDHVVNYDTDDVSSDSSIFELDETIISGDHFFLLKPFLDKYLIDDCLYFYVHLLPDPCLEV